MLRIMLGFSSPRSLIQCQWYLLRTSLALQLTSLMQYMLCFSSPRSLIHLCPRMTLLRITLSCHSNSKINASDIWYCILPSFFAREQYMLSFSSQRRLPLRAAHLVQSHTVFNVVVMSSCLDYYLSCLYHCIAAEHISTRIICSLYCAMISIKCSYNSSSELHLISE